MEIGDIVNLFVNNGVSVAIIVYFCIRDWKFQGTLQETLTTLVQTVNTLKEVLKERD